MTARRRAARLQRRPARHDEGTHAACRFGNEHDRGDRRPVAGTEEGGEPEDRVENRFTLSESLTDELTHHHTEGGERDEQPADTPGDECRGGRRDAEYEEERDERQRPVVDDPRHRVGAGPEGQRCTEGLVAHHRKGGHRHPADEQATQYRELFAKALGPANKPGEAPTTEAGTDAEEQGAEQIDGLHRK